jgi:hypothetical protein
MASPTFDGAATATASTNATATATLTSTAANDVIVVIAYNEANVAPGAAVASVTASGLSFVQRSVSNGSSKGSLEIWWAAAAAPLTAEAIAVSWVPNYDDACVIAWAINGCNTASPWDPNGGLPAKVSSSSGAPSQSGINTTNSNDLLINAVGNMIASLTQPSGWTGRNQVGNGGGINTANLYSASLSVSSPQSGLSAAWTGSFSGNAGENILDALTAGSPAASGKSFFFGPFLGIAPIPLGPAATIAASALLRKNPTLRRRTLLGGR